MTSIAKVALSGGSNGKAIKVVAVATLGTTIHTAQSGTAGFDEVWIYATNHDIVSRLLTIEFGGVTVPDNIIEQTIPSQSGAILIVPGWILQNSLVVTAFAAAANVITCGGFVNRIS